MNPLSDIAIHEAGHIIVAYGCGCTIEAVSITPSGGFTKFGIPQSFMIQDLAGIETAGWAAEEALYYTTQYAPFLKAFESFAGLAGVSIFTSVFGRDSRSHHNRLHGMVERARKDIIRRMPLCSIATC